MNEFIKKEWVTRRSYRNLQCFYIKGCSDKFYYFIRKVFDNSKDRDKDPSRPLREACGATLMEEKGDYSYKENWVLVEFLIEDNKAIKEFMDWLFIEFQKE